MVTPSIVHKIIPIIDIIPNSSAITAITSQNTTGVDARWKRWRNGFWKIKSKNDE